MGFLEIKWGAAKKDELAAREEAPVLRLGEALKVIKDAHADALSASGPTASAKLAWVGGAIRIFSILSGRAADDVMAEVKGGAVAAPAPSAAVPSPPVESFKMTRPEDRTNRPPRPPGAQRPLTPEELQQPPAPADEAVKVTATVVRRSED